jgi:acetylornithine deacetylase/succinyl-diaminopimelate desuccinylase-like protein
MHPASYLPFVEEFWERHILPALTEYIKIPCLSVAFDPAWESKGFLEQARQLAVNWLKAQAEPDWRLHDLKLAGKTPLLLVEIPARGKQQTVLLYGHLDKQPEMQGWRKGLGPWQPVIEDGKLYGRGGADDGYALFAAVAAIKALRQQGLPHARLLLLIEFSEESGSPDLPPYLETLAALIGEVDLVIALDSGTGDYERLWATTSLRGMLNCLLTVRTLHEAVHSGIAAGLVPDSLAILRLLLDRLEDAASGKLKLKELYAPIPAFRLEQARATASILGNRLLEGLHPLPGLRPLSEDPLELILNNTWRPALGVVGQEGLPLAKEAGNVMRSFTCFKLSFRLPPTVSSQTAKQAIAAALLADPPYGAQVQVQFEGEGDGWEAPAPADWLLSACDEASRELYGNPAAYLGLGASIPFMAFLGKRFPSAQFLITGVLGPNSNAHGPNEFLHLPYAKKLTACIAHVLARHAHA